jgi:hypothetical protein
MGALQARVWCHHTSWPDSRKFGRTKTQVQCNALVTATSTHKTATHDLHPSPVSRAHVTSSSRQAHNTPPSARCCNPQRITAASTKIASPNTCGARHLASRRHTYNRDCEPRQCTQAPLRKAWPVARPSAHHAPPQPFDSSRPDAPLPHASPQPHHPPCRSQPLLRACLATHNLLRSVL